jgi:hydrogenase maturation protease
MAADTRALVIGLGHPDRGDDAIGMVLAERLSEQAPNGVTVLTLGETANLLDMIDGADAVVIIDAALSGAPPGTIHRFDANAGPLPETMFTVSTHAMGLAEAIELARTLDQLPSRCIVYAIEGASFDLGRPLSPEVAAAADDVGARVLADIGERVI